MPGASEIELLDDELEPEFMCGQLWVLGVVGVAWVLGTVEVAAGLAGAFVPELAAAIDTPPATAAPMPAVNKSGKSTRLSVISHSFLCGTVLNSHDTERM